MSLPAFLVFEVRAAFRCSLRQHVATRQHPYSTTARLLARNAPWKSTSGPSSKDGTAQATRTPVKSPLNDDVSTSPDQTSTELETVKPRRSSLDTDREVRIPAKVLPKADIAPGIKLSPMQRLHIEHLTRHPPQTAIKKQQAEKQFKSRLLIYNLPRPTVTLMICTRVAAIFLAGFFTFVWLPAYYQDATSAHPSTSLPVYGVFLVWACSFVPAVAVNHLSRSIITEIFLNLPEHARRSPTAAMKYAKDLPRDATLHIRFLRWTSISGSMQIRLRDVVPVSGIPSNATPATNGATKSKSVVTAWLKEAFGKPVNFRIPMTPLIKQQSSFWKPSLTEFFVKPQTAGGRAARDTIPGLWEVVYKRLTGMDSGAVPRFRR